MADCLSVAVYKNELSVGTTSVTVSAGATVTANIADNHVDDVSVPYLPHLSKIPMTPDRCPEMLTS